MKIFSYIGVPLGLFVFVLRSILGFGKDEEGSGIGIFFVCGIVTTVIVLGIVLGPILWLIL